MGEKYGKNEQKFKPLEQDRSCLVVCAKIEEH